MKAEREADIILLAVEEIGEELGAEEGHYVRGLSAIVAAVYCVYLRMENTGKTAVGDEEYYVEDKVCKPQTRDRGGIGIPAVWRTLEPPAQTL